MLEKMVAEEQLEGRVHMMGPVPHEKARDLLVRQSSTIVGSARICGKAVGVLWAAVVIQRALKLLFGPLRCCASAACFCTC